MNQKNKVTLPALLAFIKNLAEENKKTNYVEHVQEFSTNTNTEFKCLKQNDIKITNDLPAKLRSYFDPFIKEFVRHGTITSLGANENVSIYYSILKLCVPKFSEFNKTQNQIEFIKCMREKLVAYVSNTEIFKINGYSKLGWNKKSVTQSLVQFKITKPTLKLLADYFSVNIFILNIVEDKLTVVSGSDYYDMFRYNVFMTLNNNTFEPLVYSGNGILRYDNVLVKKIVTIHKNIIVLFNLALNDNEDKNEFVIKLETFGLDIINKENDYDEITESESNIVVKDVEQPAVEKKKSEIKVDKNSDVPQGVIFNVSLKMKLSELQDMASKLNIELNKSAANGKTKVKTKNELVDEINVIMLK